MDRAPKLEIIARQGAGYNNVDVKAAEEKGIWVTNAPDATTNTVAEFALGGMIAIGKNMFLLKMCIRDRSGSSGRRRRSRGRARRHSCN